MTQALAEALARTPEERARYLDRACPDAELRREVEELLMAQGQEGAATKDVPAPPPDALQSGFRIASYEIVSQLGAGGMGVVYKARDLKLGRFVALKFLPKGSAGDPTARSRLLREAQHASSLNHPNIATIYEVGESDDQIYVVMEFVEGRTLAAVIQRKGLAPQTAVHYGIEIASALAHAHERGIIHRDLKPSNLMITAAGQVKVLDFGLAKRSSSGELAETQSQATLTNAGAIAGTPQYMAPETLRGEPADARTDIWSLGAIFHEMLLGAPPFEGKTAYELTSAILREEPKPLPQGTPTSLRIVVQRCLAKEREHRYKQANEIGAALEAIGSDGNLVAAKIIPRRNRLWAWAAAGIFILAFLAWAGFEIFSTPAPHHTVSSSDWVQLTDFADSAVSPALSPDGSILAFIRGEETFFGPGQIEAKVLPNGEPVQLTHDATAKMSPQFSPDGSRIAYTSAPLELGGWNTWTVPVLGGGEPTLMMPNAEALTWIDANHILFSLTLGGYHMAVATSDMDRSHDRVIYTPARERGMAHRSALSPDHKWILIAEMDNEGWLPCRLVPFDGSSAGKPVGPQDAACTYATWSPDGAWMYFSSNAGGRFHIWRQKFPDGKTQQVTSGGTEEEGIAMAPDGKSFVTSVGTTQRTLWLHDAQGERQISFEGFATYPEFSHDGKKLYYVIMRNGAGATFARQNGELWVADLASLQSRRLLGETLISGYDLSANDSQIAFSTMSDNGSSRLWLASLDYRFSPREFASSVDEDSPFWDDAGYIYFRAAEGKLNFIYRMKPDGTDRNKVLQDPIFELDGISPDGRRAAVVAGPNTQGLVEPLDGGTPIPVCSGYCNAGWSRDGRAFAVFISTMDGDKTIVAPLAPGKDLPVFPLGGLKESNLKQMKGAKVFDGAVIPGPGASNAFFHEQSHRNLFRVPLP